MSEIRVDTISEKTSANGVAIDGVTIKDGGIVGATTITNDDNENTLKLVCTDADQNVGPTLTLHRNSGSPADGDVVGQIQFNVQDDAPSEHGLAFIKATLSDATSGSEDGILDFNLDIAGTNRSRMTFNATEAVFNDDSQDLDFRVESNGNTHMLFVDGGNNKVGIGESANAPMGTLHIKSADSGDTAIDGNNDDLVIENDNHAGITISTPNDKVGALYFSDPDATAMGRIVYDHSTDHLSFTVNNAERMKIDSTGAVTMPAQPAFKGQPSSEQTNLSVNAWNTIVFGTEAYDTNADFASSTFTAPVTGKYILTVNLYLQNIDSAATSITCELHTSNDDYPIFVTMPGVDFSADIGFRAFNGGVLADMDANDTATVRVYPEGGAAQTDVNVSSTYSGMLIG